MSLDRLLGSLRKLKKTGPDKWIACCPAHEDGTPSLAIKDSGGTILVHCFGGCPLEDVLGAVGMGPVDLFPPREGGTRHPSEYRDGPPLKVGSVRFTALDALRCCAGEAGVALMLSCDMAEGKVLSPDERDRITLAVARMDAALTYLGDQDDLEKITTL